MWAREWVGESTTITTSLSVCERENMTPNTRVRMVRHLVTSLGQLMGGRVSLLQHFSVQGIDMYIIVITTSYCLSTPTQTYSWDSVTSICWDHFVTILYTVCTLLKSDVSSRGIEVTEHVGWLIRLLFIEAIWISKRSINVNNSWTWIEMYHNFWDFLLAAI